MKNVVWMANGDNSGHLSQQNSAMLENMPGSVSAGVSCVGILQMLTRYSAVEEVASHYVDSEVYESFETAWIYRDSELRNFRWWISEFPQKPVNEWNFDARQMPEEARLNPQYGVKEVVGLTREEFRRPEVIESLVASGKDVVFAIQLFAPTADTTRAIRFCDTRPERHKAVHIV